MAGSATTSSGVPIWSSTPSFMIAMRSPSRSASSKSWVMNTIVRGQPLLQRTQLVLHVAPDQRVERRERLVEEQHLGIEDERAGEPDALLHPAGQLLGVVVRPRSEADGVEHGGRPLPAGGLGDALHLEPVRHVVDDPPVREQAEVLEHHRHLRAAATCAAAPASIAIRSSPSMSPSRRSARSAGTDSG